MKKYLRFSCTVCKREVDKLVDNSRFVPDKCTITLSCQGRLVPVEYKSDGQITATPEIGVTDWYPRGSTLVQSTPISEPRLIDTSTGSFQQLVLAVKLSADPPSTSTAKLTLQTRAEAPKDFKSYVYRRETEFSTISGVEDGISKKTLKFKVWGTDPDEVSVYLNGVKLQEGTGPSDYQLDDGTPTPPAPSNTIKFNSPILPVGTFQVEVVVSKPQPAITRELTFNRNSDNEARLASGSWENVSHIERISSTGAAERFYLFTYDVKSNPDLTRNTILFPTGSVLVNTGSSSITASLADCLFLLSRKPYTKVDRYPDISTRLSDLDASRDYLKYVEVNGVLSLMLTETSLFTHFPPSVVYKFNPENTIKVAVAGDEEQLVVDGKLIVGPDA